MTIQVAMRPYAVLFAGKSQEEVKKIVAGPGVYICNECIDLCKEIIDEEFYEEAVREFTEVPKPLEILEVLNNYVIGQDRCKTLVSCCRIQSL